MRLMQIAFCLVVAMVACADVLRLPVRSGDALSGVQVHDVLSSTTREVREEIVYREFMSGNVPDFYRGFRPVLLSANLDGTTHTATLYVAPEYLSVGCDADYYRFPTTPILAQWIADTSECTLPTRKMCDEIWLAASCKLVPQPIPPDKLMALEPRFWEHQQLVQTVRDVVTTQPLGALVAGHKKDVVITMRLNETHHKSRRVFIYGWHRENGVAIQPLSAAHEDTYTDYSHGLRLVANVMNLDGDTTTVQAVLQDEKLHVLLSDEGQFNEVGLRYPVPKPPKASYY